MKGAPPAWAAAPSTQESPTTTMCAAPGQRAHDAEPVGIRLELHHVVARDDQVEVRAEIEAREDDVGDDAIVIGPDGGGEAELLHRDDGFPRERNEGRPLHGPPLVGDGDRHDLGLEVGGLAPHDGQQLGS